MITKVLITGAKSQLAKTLKDLAFNYSEKIEFTFKDKGELDITNQEQVDSELRLNSYDYCINCAAYTNVENAEDDIDLAFLINSEAVKQLAETCKTNNTILIHISTDYVFDGNKNTPYDEEDQTNPLNQYGKSKLLGEQHIKNTLEEHFIIRTSWLYSKYKGNFVTTIIDRIKEGRQLKIITSQKGNPTSSIDLSKFLLFLITDKQMAFGTYHFSSTGEASWYDLAKEISTYFKQFKDHKIEPIRHYETKAKRPEYSVLSNDKVSSIYTNNSNWKEQLNKVIKVIQHTS